MHPFVSYRSFGLSLKGSQDQVSKKGSQFVYFLSLPVEVSFHILTFLDATDICSIAKSSHALRQMAQDESIWKNLCKSNDWHVKETSGSDFDHKKYFMEKFSLERKGGVSWSLAPKYSGTFPSKRFKHTATAFGKYIIFIGGQETDTKRFRDVIYFDTETNTFSQPVLRGDRPPAFSRHTSVLVKGRIFVFGGYDGISTTFGLSVFNPVTCVWTNVQSSQLRGEIPQPRTNHAAAAIGNKMYIFGGNNNDQNGRYQVLNDFYSFDTDTFTWTNLTSPHQVSYPLHRSGHSLTSISEKLFLFGGGVWNENEGWVEKYSDIHVFDPSDSTWRKVECTGNIETSTFAISFSVGRFLFIFGGGSKPKYCVINDLYVLDTTSLSWFTPAFQEDEKPLPRDMGTACAVGSNVFVMGGYAGGPVSYFDKLVVPVFESHSWRRLPGASEF